MSDYDLFYWPVPFRGQFIRAILAFAGKSWTEHDAEEISDVMQRDPSDQPIPFMGPPLLIDKAIGVALSQMPAIALYLGETLSLMPEDAKGCALTIKIVNDANDVLDEITLDGGRQMWTDERWSAFVPRLRRWMTFWESLGKDNDLSPSSGYILGTPEAGIADVVSATLWGTMGARFPVLATLLDESAPLTAALVQRMQKVPELAALSRRALDDYGDAYCGGEIEASLRKVLSENENRPNE